MMYNGLTTSERISDWWADNWIYFLILGLFVISIAIFMVLANYECHIKAKSLGFECSWGPVQGCIVTLPDGTKVPLDQYRVTR